MIISTCIGETYTRRTNADMVKLYEAMGYAAERAQNVTLAQIYFQHAEHYKK